MKIARNSKTENQPQITFDELYQHCIYASAAHAVANLRFSFFSYEQSWDGDNYSFKMSSEGTISFDFNKKIIAGALKEFESPRFRQYPEYQAIELFSDAPDSVRQLADKEALQYMLEEIEGVVLPAATTAFWLDSEGLFIFDDSIDEFWENGGEFIRYLLGSFEELKEYLKAYSDLSEEETALAEHLLRKKMNRNQQNKKKDISGVDKKSEGYDEFTESLSELGFIFK